jgi:hypothetical protein
MTTDLAVLDEKAAIRVLREQIAPEATDEELAYFAQVCQRLELSPFADHICLIGRYDSRVGRKVHRHQITVAGRRTLAARTGNLRGIDGPVWSGPRDAQGNLNWLEVWDDDNNKPPYCARVLVYVEGWLKPANGTAKWSEFSQTDNKGNLLPLWRKMPSHMLGKVAESLALRRAFPDTINADVIGGYQARGVTDLDDYEHYVMLDEVAASSSPPGTVTDPGSQDDGGDAPAGNHLPSREASPPSYPPDDPERPFDLETGEIIADEEATLVAVEPEVIDVELPAETDGIAVAQQRANQVRARHDTELFPDSNLEQKSTGELRTLAEERGLIEAGTTSRTHPKTKLLEVLRGAG